MYSGNSYSLAFDKIADVVKMCSITPGIPDRNPFCTLGSMMEFAKRNFSRRLAMILLNNFPTVEVKAIGLKELGSVAGPDLCTRIIFPMHHEEGQVWDSRSILEKSVARK